MHIARAPLSQTIPNMFFYGISYGFNDPAWYAPTLFFVSVGYASIRFIVKKHWNDCLGTIIFLGFGTVAVFMAHNGSYSPYFTLLLKIVFFQQFYHIGIFLKSTWKVGSTKQTRTLCLWSVSPQICCCCSFMEKRLHFSAALLWVDSKAPILFFHCWHLLQALLFIWSSPSHWLRFWRITLQSIGYPIAQILLWRIICLLRQWQIYFFIIYAKIQSHTHICWI